MMQTVLAQAPANLALVKYMGKKEVSLNLPANSSVSLTLGSLRTLAQVTSSGRGDSRWVPELPEGGKGFEIPQLVSLSRILDHVERVRNEVPRVFARFGVIAEGLAEGVVLRTANTFPASSGIASSASSFAAMTLALVAYFAGCSDRKKSAIFQSLWDREFELRREVGALARQGSGSACRSFEGPWVCWDEVVALPVPHQMPVLSHFVLILDASVKEVSSSQAHARVTTSALWEHRISRANFRTQEMLEALRKGDVVRVSEIAWSEFWEMHSLFHTSHVPFSYWVGQTVEVLHWAKLQRLQDPELIVTLDAGPNVHFLIPKTKRAIFHEKLKHQFEAVLLTDEQGMGASFFPLL